MYRAASKRRDQKRSEPKVKVKIKASGHSALRLLDRLGMKKEQNGVSV